MAGGTGARALEAHYGPGRPAVCVVCDPRDHAPQRDGCHHRRQDIAVWKNGFWIGTISLRGTGTYWFSSKKYRIVSYHFIPVYHCEVINFDKFSRILNMAIHNKIYKVYILMH